MKLKSLPLAAMTALIITGQASAATLLFSDNFNTEGVGPAAFNDAGKLAADQAGTLATTTYSINTGAGWDGAFQRGNGGMMLMYAGTGGYGSSEMRASVNQNFATAANDLGLSLEIEFNMSVSSGVAADDWTSFSIGSSQNPFITASTVGFGSLFRDNGGTEQWDGGSSVGGSATFTDGNMITFVLSNAAGSGSAFISDGATDIAKMYVNGTLSGTWSNLDLGPNDGFISFHANNTVAQIDNLSVTAIPEPSAALLGGLGMLALLRRRRA